jgi:hypothetical protein
MIIHGMTSVAIAGLHSSTFHRAITSFRVKAVSGDGGSVEKSIRIIISPPWWKNMVGLYLVCFVSESLQAKLIFRYQSIYIIRRERARNATKRNWHRQRKLKKLIKN